MQIREKGHNVTDTPIHHMVTRTRKIIPFGYQHGLRVPLPS
jgi:hypothetical protein